MTNENISPVATGILQGLNEALAYANGQPLKGTRVSTVDKINPSEIRKKLNMSQNQFARAFCIPVGTLRNWEQGRRQIDRTSAAYLRTISQFPQEVQSAQNTI